MNVDAAVRAAGLLTIVVGIAAFDLRAGAVALGVALILSTLDLRRPA